MSEESGNGRGQEGAKVSFIGGEKLSASKGDGSDACLESGGPGANVTPLVMYLHNLVAFPSTGSAKPICSDRVHIHCHLSC